MFSELFCKLKGEFRAIQTKIMEHMFDPKYMGLIEDEPWWTRICLFFCTLQTRNDGTTRIFFKKFRGVLYVTGVKIVPEPEKQWTDHDNNASKRK